jgi:hypothetical protein
VPGLGTGINKGLEWLGSAGNVANGLAEDYKKQGDNFGFSDMYKNVTSGKYTKKPKVPKGIGLSQRPDQLNDRIELKSDVLALMPPDDEGEGEIVYGDVEEVD